MKFSYLATTASGKKQKGKIEALDIREATRILFNKGLYLKKISPTGFGRLFLSRGLSWGRVSATEKLLFIKHLLAMTKAGISLVEALEVISEQTASKKFKKIVLDLKEGIIAGQRLSFVLAKYQKIFNPLFINIIKVGEESGTLQENLEYLASDLENRLDLQRKIKSAALYPMIIIGATFGLGLILAYFVLPKITRLFKTLKFELPLTTKILLKVAAVMDQYGTIILGGVILGIILGKIILTSKPVRPIWHWLILKFPLIGKITRNYNLALISRTFSILLKSGLPVDYALNITADTISNYIYRKKLKSSISLVQKGEKISEILARVKQSKHKPFFPLLATKMINVGETTGQLQDSLEYLAKYYEKEVDLATKNLSNIIEPILLLAVGLIVAFIAISIITPIYQVTSGFGR